ncbi:hypothetical protein SAMN05892883_3163 [Jatrophihabitans sp. GAS493]|uniref:hypothetical protein n=1 Tax=Jatrophihabitans sp. GAS493 TaxID=1907575 RepID=UPI000BB6B5A8|nr:hypothetical protein [Jatrophihabitans sp. GAS493]SOD73975.1 hypothetical protein SAMN05892883_3163 [Jatrophihabitans sp. GAS493]
MGPFTAASSADSLEDQPRCSAKACVAAAEFQLHWRNPGIHSQARTKVWLACSDHRATLGEFLSSRGFLIGIEPYPGA